MPMCDWSSDVCSSDLGMTSRHAATGPGRGWNRGGLGAASGSFGDTDSVLKREGPSGYDLEWSSLRIHFSSSLTKDLPSHAISLSPDLCNSQQHLLPLDVTGSCWKDGWTWSWIVLNLGLGFYPNCHDVTIPGLSSLWAHYAQTTGLLAHPCGH